MEQRTYPEIDAAIAALPLTYTATFVPQSVSRNAGKKDRTLNWRIALTPGKEGASVHGKTPLLCDYSQGIGHIPRGRIKPNTIDSRNNEYEASERGRYYTEHNSYMARKLPPPNVRDVFYSLVREADVLSAGTFEDWAADFDMDTDSRKAEDLYKVCVAQSRAFVALIGRDNLAQLQTLFQDY